MFMRQISMLVKKKDNLDKYKSKSFGLSKLFTTLVFLFLVLISPPESKCQESGRDESINSNGVNLDAGKKLISLTELVPSVTPVSNYTGGFWRRSTMFGDIGGIRQKIYEDGFTLDAALTQVFQWVAAGGAKKNDYDYTGLLDYGFTIDTGKTGLWSGGLFVVNAETGFAGNFPLQAGTLSPTNYTSLLPEPDKPSTFLMEYYLMQAISEHVSIVVGRINAANFLDRNRFANDPRNQFLNISMDNDPLVGEFASFSTYGILVPIEITDYLSISPAVFDPNIQPGDWFKAGDGIGFFDDVGMGAEAQLNWNLCKNLGGALRVDYIYTTKDAINFNNPYLPVDIILDNPLPTKSNNWVIMLNAEQYLWKPSTSAHKDSVVRTASFDFQEPGIGVFSRFGYAPEDRNPWNLYLSGGIGGRGFIPNRPFDRAGLGIYWLKESNDLKATLDALQLDLLEDEVGFEAFYNLAITPWLQLSVDLQWINPGIQSTKDTLVLGTRLFTQF